MMKKISKINYGNLGKSFSIFFILITVLQALIFLLTTGKIIVGWLPLAVNIIIAAIISYMYYKFRYHVTFSYDNESFILEIGKEKISSKWKDFKFVSLYYSGLVKTSIKLYKGNIYKDYFLEIPVSDLGLPVKDFRNEVQELISN
jgi:hypothetical protein